MLGSPLHAALLLLGLAACTDPNEPNADEHEPAPLPTVVHPRLVLSDASLEFGTLPWNASDTRTLVASNAGTGPLGIGEIRIGDDPTSFSVAWDPCDVTCDGAPPAACDTGVAVLGPGCELPITVTYTAERDGDAQDAVVIDTVTDSATPPAWNADLLHAYDVVYLHGSTAYAVPQIFVTPRVYSFGFDYPGVPVPPADVRITNLGNADLTLTDATLVGCATAYTLTSTFETGLVLAPGASTGLEIWFAPTDVYHPARCLVEVRSNDPVQPVVDVTFHGETPDVPNTPPTVTLDDPVGPTELDPSAPLRIAFTVADPDQPASTLGCVVRSALLDAWPVVYCTPEDDGHVTVEIDGALLPAGVDVVSISVVDARHMPAYTTFPLRVDTPAPPGDLDGDGFEPAGVPSDCDESDASVYPEAIERADGLDNDCNGMVDEGTTNFDDDGDTLTEADGDCDDSRDDDFPGALERGDGRDNDCDGLIDEGTSLSDDDGDGFLEVENDCDDTDPTVHPGAEESCLSVDKNCDGLLWPGDCGDENMGVVGNIIHFEQTSMLEGETIWMEVRTHSPDGATLSCAWSPPAAGTLDDPAATRVSYTAGVVAAASGRAAEDLSVSISHPDGANDVATGVVSVYDGAFDLYGE